MDLETVKKTLQDYFGDTSRSPAETKAGLNEIIDEAVLLAESIHADDDGPDDLN